MLKLNDDKSEILIIHPKSAPQHLLLEGVRIDYNRTLAVTFDSYTSLEQHVTDISRTAYYNLHSIGRSHTKQLVHALVISRFGCCNSLLNELFVTIVGNYNAFNVL